MKRKLLKKYKRWVWMTELALVLALFPILYNFYLPLGEKAKTLYFSDTDMTHSLDTLKRHGFNVSDLDYRLAPWLTFAKEGWFRIDPVSKWGRVGFYRALFSTPASPMRLRIYGGDAKEDMLRKLSQDTKLPLEKLREAYRTLGIQEGEILAGSYDVARNADAFALVDALRRISLRRIRSLFVSYGWVLPDANTTRTLFTIASIVQKETRRPKEMPLVASVIYNRLAKGMKLQMDGTLNYGPYSHIPVTPERIKEDTSRYNTYRYKGLPPAPLSAFSSDALAAALRPATTDYLFFMLQRDGSHHFSSTYEEHLEYQRAFNLSKKRAKARFESAQP